MKYSNFDDYDENTGLSAPVIYTIFAVVGILLVIALIVFSQNRSGKKEQELTVQKVSPAPAEENRDLQFSEKEKDLELLYENHELRAEDLDFWDMYRNEAPPEKEIQAMPSATPEMNPSPSAIPENDNIEKNTVNYTNLKITNDQMTYYVDGQKQSWLGVELSKDSGQVDFDWLKRNGVDFVMLKIGSRGYESGVITQDDKFAEYMEAAKKAELDVGVFFSSQAISVKEAVEEAQFVASTLQSYSLRYPVAYTVEYVVNDDARVQLLDKDEKSQVAEAFLQSIQDAGYVPILYGNPDWLLDELWSDVLLENYDVMLNDVSTVPDYPYRFQMWKYSSNKKIAGIEFGGSYIISFVNYSVR